MVSVLLAVKDYWVICSLDKVKWNRWRGQPAQWCLLSSDQNSIFYSAPSQAARLPILFLSILTQVNTVCVHPNMLTDVWQASGCEPDTHFGCCKKKMPRCRDAALRLISTSLKFGCASGVKKTKEQKNRQDLYLWQQKNIWYNYSYSSSEDIPV